MNIIFQSPRLYFRKLTEEDVALLLDLDSNPNVTKYMHRPAPTIENILQELHQRILPHYKTYGYGRWAIHLKQDNNFIGTGGLKYMPELDEADMGYQLKEAYWGKGYGYEAARAMLDYGLAVLKLPAIFAKALPENTASWKIMEKCGMQYLEDVMDANGLMVKKYCLNAF
ncbi:GNAT family N-acetyltransferase [Parafilimonas sp.]|uniref:GNAT family N-acetyltransferase n=1 Tax=Parafilimonas sp. TaxID=1969739 RepID=UPI0039E23B56